MNIHSLVYIVHCSKPSLKVVKVLMYYYQLYNKLLDRDVLCICSNNGYNAYMWLDMHINTDMCVYAWSSNNIMIMKSILTLMSECK